MQHYSWEVMEGLERVNKIARESAVVIFSISTCCMCHAMKRLFCGLGVHPTVYELDLHDDPTARKCIDMALAALLLRDGGGNSATTKTTYDSAVPVVFIGGKLVGAMDRVMASHINGTLVPLLKQAGALWL